MKKRYNESEVSYNDRMYAYKVLNEVEIWQRQAGLKRNELYKRICSGEIEACRELFTMKDIDYIEGQFEKADGNMVRWIMPQSHFKILTAKERDKLFKGIK